MTDKNDWQIFFDSFAPQYMSETFTRNTKAEVDFLIDEMKLAPGSCILDIGCGTGRHSVELAKRGYLMTGVDLSTGMLAEAEKAAKEAGVEIELIHSNAAEFHTDKIFDGAICLCEGAFGLLRQDDDPNDRDLAILKNISAALKPGAKLIMTILNGLRMVREASQEDVKSDKFNPAKMLKTYTYEWDSPVGKKSIQARERGYVPTELALLTRLAGFGLENIWGGTAGNWGHREIELDEIEIMVVAEKNGNTGVQ